MILSVPPRLAVQSGKDGLVRLLDRDDLSGQGGPAHKGGISGFQLSVSPGGVPFLVAKWANAAAGTSPVVANGLLYYAGSGALHALDPTTGATLWSDTTDVGGIHWESPPAASR